jgi:hypothetical protein
MTSPGSFVRVWTDVGARKPVPLLAKIVEKDGIILVIRYLSENRDKIWRYEDETYEVENCPESIAEYLDTDKEDEVGFLPCEGGFRKMDSDDDYVPNSDEEDYEDSDEDEYEEEGEEIAESSDVEGSESEDSLEEY